MPFDPTNILGQVTDSNVIAFDDLDFGAVTTQTLTLTQTQSATLARVLAAARTLAVSQTQTPTLARVLSAFRTLAVTQTQTPSLTATFQPVGGVVAPAAAATPGSGPKHFSGPTGPHGLGTIELREREEDEILVLA